MRVQFISCTTFPINSQLTWADKVELFCLGDLPTGVAHQVQGVVHGRHPVLPSDHTGNHTDDHTYQERKGEQLWHHGGGGGPVTTEVLLQVSYLYVLISCEDHRWNKYLCRDSVSFRLNRLSSIDLLEQAKLISPNLTLINNQLHRKKNNIKILIITSWTYSHVKVGCRLSCYAETTRTDRLLYNISSYYNA